MTCYWQQSIHWSTDYWLIRCLVVSCQAVGWLQTSDTPLHPQKTTPFPNSPMRAVLGNTRPECTKEVLEQSSLPIEQCRANENLTIPNSISNLTHILQSHGLAIMNQSSHCVCITTKQVWLLQLLCFGTMNYSEVCVTTSWQTWTYLFTLTDILRSVLLGAWHKPHSVRMCTCWLNLESIKVGSFHHSLVSHWNWDWHVCQGLLALTLFTHHEALTQFQFQKQSWKTKLQLLSEAVKP